MTRFAGYIMLIVAVALIGCDGSSRVEVARMRAELDATRVELAKVRAELNASAAESPRYLDELERLDSLRSKGALSEEEFEAKKRTLLNTPTIPKPADPVAALSIKEVSAELRTLQSLFQNSTITSQEHSNRKARLLAKPMRLTNLKADLEEIQKLFNETAITNQEQAQLKQTILMLDSPPAESKL